VKPLSDWLERYDGKCIVQVYWFNTEHVGMLARWKEHKETKENWTHMSWGAFLERYSRALFEGPNSSARTLNFLESAYATVTGATKGA
jgi:hypothetical protein